MRGIRSGLSAVLVIGLLAGTTTVAIAQEDVTDPSAAAWVTGSVVFGRGCEDPTVSTEDGVLMQRGFWCGVSIPQQWTSDDPRFTGSGIVAHDSDAYTTDDGSYQVITSAFEVRNDAGGWQCTNADALLAGTSLQGGSNTSASTRSWM